MVDKFNIVVDGDITPFERKISQIESKIKKMREFGPSGTYSQLSQQYKEQGNNQKSQKMEEYRQRAASQGRRQLATDLKNQENLLKKNEMAQQRVSNSLNSTLKTQENLNRAKEMQIKLEEKHLGLVKNISSIKSSMSNSTSIDRGAGMGPFSGRDMTFMKRSMGGGRGVMGGAAAAGRLAMKNPMVMAGGLGLAGSAIQGGGQFASQIMTYPERIAKREATTSNMLGETARLQSQRRGYEMSYYAPERQKALERAGTRVDAAKTEDITGFAGSTLKGMGIGAGIGATVMGGAGALLGSVIPGAGTVAGGMAGAGIGAKIGAGIGGLFSAGSQMTNDRKRSMITDPFTGKNNYTKEMDAIFSEGYIENVAIEKAKNFEKSAAADFYEKNSKKFLGVQRQFGLSDKELFGGKDSILKRGSDAHFLQDTVMSSMQGFSAAGGRASLAGEAGIAGAKMQRDMDLTNAPSLLGKISGVTGEGVPESKDAIMRMHAEATRMGLDASEVRTLLQTSADIASKSGGSTDVISQLLGAGVGDLKTGRGIQASATALDKIRQETGQMGGLVGQNQLAEFADVEVGKGDNKRKLSLGEQAFLGGTDIGKLDPESRFIKGLQPDMDADERKEFVKSLQRKKIRATHLSDEQTSSVKELYNAKKDFNNATPENKEELEKKFNASVTKTKSAFAASNLDTTKLSKEELNSYLELQGKVLSKDELSEEEQGKLEGIKTKISKRLGDKGEKSGSKDEAGRRSNFNDKIPDLVKAFENTTEKTGLLSEAMDNLRKAYQEGDGSNKEGLREEFKKLIEGIDNIAKNVGNNKEGTNNNTQPTDVVVDKGNVGTTEGTK